MERALALAEAVHARVPAERPGQRAIAAHIASALFLLRAELGGGRLAQTDLDRALEKAELAVRLRQMAAEPAPHLPPVAQFLAHVATVRQTRLRITGDHRELDGAIEAVRSAAGHPGTALPEHVAALVTLGALLLERHLLTGASADLDEAVQVGRDVVGITGPTHGSYAGACNNLALALRNRYERRGNRADLDEAVTHARNGTKAAADGFSRAACLGTLAGALVVQYGHQGDPRTLDESVDAGRTALAEAGLPSPATVHPEDADASEPPVGGTPDAVPILINLATALRCRHERTGGLQDLDEAIATTRRALRISPPLSADHPACLNQLATALQQRSYLTGDTEDLDEAVDAGCKALRRCPARHPSRGLLLNNHARALRLRFERDGDAGDLDEAIATVRPALRSLAPEDVAYALCHAQLSTLTLLRHQLAGDPVDLDTAVAAAAEAVAAATPGDPHQGMYLNALGIAHQERFTQRADPADIDAAVRVGRQAVHITPRSHPMYPAYQLNLGNTLVTRWVWRLQYDDGLNRRTGEPLSHGAVDLTDLNDGITAHRAALDTAEGITERARCSANLGTALRWRYQQTGATRDAQEAEDLLREAVRLHPINGPVRGSHLCALAELLSARHQHTGDRGSATEAIALWRRAAQLPTAAVAERIAAATSWGGLAIQLGRKGDEAVEGMATAVDLLPLLAWRGLHRVQRERLLADCAGLAQDAAATALAAGRPEQAVELLESGRSVLWSQLLEQHTALDALRAAAPALATRLDQLRSALDGSDSTGGVFPPPAIPLADSPGTPAPATPSHHLWLQRHDAVDRRMAPAREWDQLIEEVRGLPGFENFLRRSRLSELRSALPGPVVVVNVSTLRCDALIVTGDAVRVVPLPHLTARDAHTRTVGLLTAIHEADRATGSAGTAARMVREQTLLDVLEWLWEAVAAPVLETLRLTTPVPPHGSWKRLWWCPTGPLALLPLHAAGRPAEPGSNRPRTGDSVLDRVISSYTPTLRSLVRAPTPAGVRHAGRGAERTGMLTVTVAEAPGLPVLRGVRREAEAVTRLFPSRFHRLLDGASATRDAVRTALAGHAWAHLSCHGGQDLTTPSRAGLHLHDGLLTVAELATARPEGPGELAYLSACETAMGGAGVPDEAITLAHAFQFTGYRQVVATLWSVEDTLAVRTAEDFYSRMARTADSGPVRAAEALHHAVRALRAHMPHAPGRWASYVHVGA
ncbi:CHAT domain-containing protein [Streptomyces toyocaensis]|uniref:CHAT domain-containing protein n=1 Tax=Streptomyces toyocaensis TaxID=55952 RepID=UPI000AF49EBF|nr:CHAT domain-containing protein [Streptomyces toyocaensis]